MDLHLQPADGLSTSGGCAAIAAGLLVQRTGVRGCEWRSGWGKCGVKGGVGVSEIRREVQMEIVTWPARMYGVAVRGGMSKTVHVLHAWCGYCMNGAACGPRRVPLRAGTAGVAGCGVLM